MPSDNTVTFVDTSIQIARALREPPMRSKIDVWLRRYRLKITGTIAILEFRNRVLRDAYYLLSKLNQLASYQKTLAYVSNVLPRHMDRKRRICTLILHQLLPGATDAELTERARLYCRTLLVYGESRFLQGVDSVGPGIGCHWAQVPVHEKRRYQRYEFGDQRCSKSGAHCGLPRFLTANIGLCTRLLAFLDALPANRRTAELERARSFLDLVVRGQPSEEVAAAEPCLKIGDVLLAIESARTPEMYTMNFKESQAYCDVLGQDLAIRPNDPEHDERLFRQADKPWPLP